MGRRIASICSEIFSIEHCVIGSSLVGLAVTIMLKDFQSGRVDGYAVDYAVINKTRGDFP